MANLKIIVTCIVWMGVDSVDDINMSFFMCIAGSLTVHTHTYICVCVHMS